MKSELSSRLSSRHMVGKTTKEITPQIPSEPQGYYMPRWYLTLLSGKRVDLVELAAIAVGAR